MASLEELRRKLYGREEPENGKEEKKPLREYGPKSSGEPKKFWGGEGLKILQKATSQKKTNRFFVNILIFSFVLLLGIGVYIAYEIFFVSQDIKITIAGPNGVEMGDKAQFAVFVKNTGQVGLSDVEVNITYPDHAVALSPTGEPKGVNREKVTFNSVAPGEEVKYDILAQFFGAPGDSENISVLVIYRPENIQSRLTKKAEFATSIIRSPFVITFTAPEEVSQNQHLGVVLQVNSEAKSMLSNVSFRVDYPSGFEFESADPAPSFENNIWSFGDFNAGDSRKIMIRGTIHGQPEEVKSFHAVVGQYDPTTKEWVVFLDQAKGPKISSPFLFVEQQMNGRREGTVNGGDNAQFVITYKNNLSKAIDDVVITERLGEGVLDLSKLRVDGGAYDPVSHEIRWTAATFPKLKEVGPGESGTVNFSISLRPSPPLRSFSDKNFTFDAKAIIDTKTIPVEFSGVKLTYEDDIQFKINTKLTLNTRAVYFDSPVENTGPLPPKVRQETTYTVYWQLANQSNDAVNVEVKGGLPANVKWLGTVGDAPGNAIFNAASNEVVWNIPRVGAATGILKPQAMLVFRVALTPGEDQIGSSPVLVSQITADGADSFTNEKLHDGQDAITTALQTDTTRNFEQWKVVP